MGVLDGLRASIDMERRWYLEAFVLAEAELLKLNPPHSLALDRVQNRIAGIKEAISAKEPNP
jgi:hypothetical protein